MPLACIVPARAGSKRIPGKNMASCGGKPLIHWTLQAAHDANLSGSTYVTTDDPAVKDYADRCGITVIERPLAFATDTTPMDSVVMHALDHIPTRYDKFLLLQPTSPLRTGKHVWDFLLSAGDAIMDPNIHAMCSVVRTGPTSFEENGMFYYFTRDHFHSTGSVRGCGLLYEMPADVSVDVDTPEDLREADDRLR